MDYEPLHSFQISSDMNLAALAFDTDMNGNSFDILIKDLSINRLMPVILRNTDGEIAFDKHNGVYYS
jgi:protease II